ncbi:MAG: bacterial Ig-like domain-containing protein, partial [Candidatus Methanomethylophilaceae archaeon]|nr:bacterial Ig-like domain-containing protein [Candidatus Methanomethylophilaceae archaeon]
GYLEGEKFDPTGLTIALKYSDGSMGFLDYKGNESKFSFSPSTDTPLKASDTKVTITYESKSATQDITVKGSSGSDDTVIYVAIGAIAAVLIVGAAALLLRKRAV